MVLHWSILKPLFQPTWLEDTQVEAEHHQMTKQVTIKGISISLTKVTYHHNFQSFNRVSTFVSKKELT